MAAPAADRAYALTKELVLSGEFPAGICSARGTSPTGSACPAPSVREAFLRLQAEDFLRLIPKRGAVVVPVPPGEAEDVLDAREAIETAAVRRLLRRPEDVPVTVADEIFHRAIVAAGGNALTMRF
jgi:DNA-binding GntR family transcriptional regulator